MGQQSSTKGSNVSLQCQEEEDAEDKTERIVKKSRHLQQDGSVVRSACCAVMRTSAWTQHPRKLCGHKLQVQGDPASLVARDRDNGCPFLVSVHTFF